MATPDGGVQRHPLADVITLLDQAATRIWEHGGGTEPWQSLGLGVYLTQAHAAALLPGGPASNARERPTVGQQTVVDLLTAARRLCQPSAPSGAGGEPSLIAVLVAELDALIGEATGLGC